MKMNGILSVFSPLQLSVRRTRILQDERIVVTLNGQKKTQRLCSLKKQFKKSEAEEINIFIAFAWCALVKFRPATGWTTTAMMIVSRCESLDPYLKRGPCHA